VNDQKDIAFLRSYEKAIDYVRFRAAWLAVTMCYSHSTQFITQDAS